jgi:hypothetical protein
MGKKGIVSLVIGAALLCAAGAIGFVLLVKYAADRRAAREQMVRAEREAEVQAALAAERAEHRAEVVAAFADPTRPTPEEEAEFAPVFASLGGALERGDASAATRAFDPDRMMRELERIGTFSRLPPNVAGPFKNGVRKGMNEKIGENLVANELTRWTRTDVRHVRWSADRQEAVVVAVHRTDDTDDVPLRIRWSLVRRAGGWKIFDYEDLHMGLSATQLLAAISTPEGIERLARNPGAFQRAVAGLRDGFVLLARGDFDGGDKALAPARAIQLPAQVQAVLEVAEGTILIGRGDAAGALARFDAGDRLLPGMPLTALARASAYVHLGRPDDALAAIRAYQKEIGPDGLSCALEGVALESQGKNAEAADAYRRTLDEVADSAEAFNGLRRVLPDAQKKELGERLARVKNPNKLYNELVAAARRDGDGASVAALLDGLRKADPNDPRALGEDIRRQVKAEQFADAAKLLARGLKSAKREDRLAVLDAYLFAMLGANKAPEAYAAVPDALADRAFRKLAEDLEDDLFDANDETAEGPLKQLGALIDAHRARNRFDAWLWYFEAATLQHAKQYAQAEKGYAAGAAMLPRVPPPSDDPDERPWDADRFRERRVVCLFKLKKGLDAYRTLGPPVDTFRQLAGLYDAEKNLEGLAALIAAHRAAGVRDPERTFWEARLLFRKGENARAAAGYDKYLDESGENAPNRWMARTELIRALLRSRPADAGKRIAEFGPENVSAALRAAAAAATNDRAELERLLAETVKNGGKTTWFYSDEDFRRFIYQDKYRDLRAKYPDPNPAKLDG